MITKLLVQVRTSGQTVQTIKRKLYAEQIGNFNPLFCRFAGKTYLVKSDEGDLSDPFRRDESYKASLFIETEKPCQWHL